MIVLDISRSMLAEDIIPNRISHAKNILQSFISENSHLNFGLILFAGKPFLSIAQSSDSSGIRHFIQNISPQYILQEKPGLSGTNIGDALLLATTQLQKYAEKKSIILITDGSANIGSDPIKSTLESQHLNIPIYTIGVGGTTQEPLYYTNSKGKKIFFLDENGEKIIWDLDEKLLQEIAIMTKGEYFHANNAAALFTTFQQIQSLLTPETQETLEFANISLIPLCALIIIILILLEWWFSGHYYRRYHIIS